MNKLTDSNLSQLSQYLQSHREKTSLSLKIKFRANIQQNLPIIKVIEEELNQLTHLTDLSLLISKHSILTAEGYYILSKAVLNLKALKNISLDLNQSCFLENEGLSIIKDIINRHPELVCLKLKIGKNNYITLEVVQQLLDSLSGNTNLTTLNLHFEDIQSSTINESSFHFWRGLSNLNNLEELMLSFNYNNYGYSDVIELFQHIASLQNLRSLSLNITNSNYETRVLDELFPQIGKMRELRSLKINYINENYILEDQQRETILRNLSNLKFLEYLQLNSLEQHLFKDSFEEYINLIKDLACLKEFSILIENSQVQNYDQINSLSKTLPILKNLTHLEFKLEQKDSNAWRGFFSDLSSAFKEMHNLLSLNLEFKSEISQKGCNKLEESFLHLKQLEKLQLSILFETEVNKSGLLYNLGKLNNLKELKLLIICSNLGDEEENILLDSISELNQLEKLHLIEFNSNNIVRIKNLEALSYTLKNLRKLKQLECGLCIQNLHSQNQLDLLEKCFENLSNLETLNIQLNILQKTIEFQNISLIKYLTKLKRIEIVFCDFPLNIFGISVKQEQQELESCILRFEKSMSPQEFMEIFESISDLNIRKLDLKLNLTYDLKYYKEQFGIACSKLSSLEKLVIIENGYGNLMQLIPYIEQMKQLKSLNLEFNRDSLTTEGFQMFNDILNQLSNLEKLQFKLICGKVIGEASDIFSLQQLKSLRNLKYVQFTFKHQIGDCLFNKVIEVANACFLDLEQRYLQSLQHNNKSRNYNLSVYNVKKDEEILLSKLKISQENELKNEDNDQLISEQLYPIELKIQIVHKSKEKFTKQLCDFGFINTSYLNKLKIRWIFDLEYPVELELLQPLRDLKKESKLTHLKIGFRNLAFNPEQFYYFSRNFQFLTNLQSLIFLTTNCQGDYCLLFDSFKHLVNLHHFDFSTTLSEKEAVSLGNSLKSMIKLEFCDMKFQENCTIGLEGISSLLSGIKQQTNLKILNLKMTTQQILQDCQMEISEWLSNLKYLEQLNLELRIDCINQQCLRELFTSIGSFRYLKILSLKIKETYLINQDIIDELIKNITKLMNLKENNIQISVKNKNSPIKFSEEFATIFNMHPRNTLTIHSEYGQLSFNQLQYNYAFKPQIMDNFELDFLEHLDERVEVSLKIEDILILKQIKLPSTKRISVWIFVEGGVGINQFCEFISQISNVFDLRIAAYFSNNQNIEDLIIKTASNLTKLLNLRVLKLKLFNGFSSIPSLQLRKVLAILRKMEQLQELYLQTGRQENNKQMIPYIQKSILRLVKFDQQLQIC